MNVETVNGVHSGDFPDSQVVRTSHAAAIRDAVARSFDVTPSEIGSPTRTRNVAWARQVAMWIIARETALSMPEIGNLFGRRDHTTVLYSISRVDGKVAANPRLRQWIEMMRIQCTSQPSEAAADSLAGEVMSLRGELAGIARDALALCARMDSVRARTRTLLTSMQGGGQ